MSASWKRLMILAVVAIAVSTVIGSYEDRHRQSPWQTFLCGCSMSQPVSGAEKIVVERPDLEGRLHRPFEPGDSAATVLFFLLPDCPICNASAPEIKRIATDYSAKDVSCLIVYVDPDLSPAEAQQQSRKFGEKANVILDTNLVIAKQAEAKTAPQAVLIGRDGQICYSGRINDLYTDLGKRRVQPSQHDLRDALDCVLAGRPVTTRSTKAIGCPINHRP